MTQPIRTLDDASIDQPQAAQVSRLRALVTWLGARERDAYFWLGLALLWVGLAGDRSPWVACSVVGGALFFVAVGGVASTKRSS